MQWFEIISILGVVQGGLLALLLVFRKNNRAANRFWALFVALFALGLTEPFYQSILPFWANAALGGLVFLYGPLLYFYVRSFLGDPVGFRIILRHTSTTPIYWALLLLWSLIGNEGNDLVEFGMANFFFLQLIGYTLASLRRVRRARQAGSADRAVLAWMNGLLLLLLGVYALAFITTYLLAFGMPFAAGLLPVVQVGCVGVVYVMSYWALVQPDLVKPRQEAAREQARYQNSALTAPDKEQYLRQILNYLEQKKAYLEPDLTLDGLAKQLGINRFYVSQVINEQLGKSFTDLVNGYRVEVAKQLLTDPAKAHFSIVGVGFEAGFNSKTAFNTTFKKVTGLSPSEYRKLPGKDVRFEQPEHGGAGGR
ncbi:helix-turn-helix domain-containing protein [Larkinella soli]|uniref:helix-turn-helix domain-containing protein n=1 Tax=Larkinella soli TaxID=1770527 RepID=UPI000FFB716A|nr:helix-turn-helix domain-containing protein [Larkinella soli]